MSLWNFVINGARISAKVQTKYQPIYENQTFEMIDRWMWQYRDADEDIREIKRRLNRRR